MAAMFGKREPRFDFVQVRPGEAGTTADAFDTFTYWVPSDELQRRLLRQARELGLHGQPNPTSIGIPEMDEIKAFRQLTRQAAFNCAQAARQLFAKDNAEIRRLVSVLLSGPEAGDHNPESTMQVRRARLDALAGNIVNLEKALDLRLATLGGHFDALRDTFMGGVYSAHRLETKLRARGWSIDGFHISDDMRDFGQVEARAEISRASPSGTGA